MKKRSSIDKMNIWLDFISIAISCILIGYYIKDIEISGFRRTSIGWLVIVILFIILSVSRLMDKKVKLYE